MSIRIVFLLSAVLACSCVGYAQSNVLLALNKGEATLTFLDADTMKVTGKVTVGDGPHEVVISADGKTAFVSNYGAQTPGSSISMIDIASKKELRRVDVSPLLRPHGLQVAGGKLYFTSETTRSIARYDPVANKVDWLMGTGQNASHMVVGSPDQKRFYTANIGSDTVTMFEFNAAPPAQSRITQIAVGKQPEAIDLSPDGKQVWAGLNVDNGVDVIDTATQKVTARIAIGQRPYRVRFTPDGKEVVCTIPATKEIIVYDAATRKELRRAKLESTPLGITFTPDSKTAFVTVVDPDAVVRIDLAKLTVTAQAASGTAPDGVAYFGS